MFQYVRITFSVSFCDSNASLTHPKYYWYLNVLSCIQKASNPHYLRIRVVWSESSRKHAYIILDPLNPTFIQKNWGLQGCTLFFIFQLRNIDCGYSLEPPRRGGSNEYPQSEAVLTSTHNLCFWAKICKNIRTFIWKFSVFGGEIFYIWE